MNGVQYAPTYSDCLKSIVGYFVDSVIFENRQKIKLRGIKAITQILL